MKLVDVRDVLVSTGIPTYHYSTPKEVGGSFIVWAEEGQGNCEYADDKMISQGIEGTIFYLTQVEFDPAFDAIQEKLNSADLSWKLEKIVFNEETQYIQFEWSFEITNYLEGLIE